MGNWCHFHRLGRTYAGVLDFWQKMLNHNKALSEAEFGFPSSAELLLCVLVFERATGCPVIWLMLTGAYNTTLPAFIGRLLSALSGNEQSLMYHPSSLVST